MPRILFLLLLLTMVACQPFEAPEDISDTASKTMDQLTVPDGFTFQTQKEVDLTIRAVDNASVPLKNIPISIYMQLDPGLPAQLTGSGWIGSSGVLEMRVNVPTASCNLIVRTTYPGLPDIEVDPANATRLELVLGAGNQVKDRSAHAVEQPAAPVLHTDGARSRSTLEFMGSFDSQGVPNYLTSPGDVVHQDILNVVANSLPESQPVPTFHPEYIASETETNTVLLEDCEIWVTFVHEGAGYRNTLGYYTYPNGMAPAQAAELGALTIIYPNVSFPGSGGNLHTGDKVYLGIFPAGTTIGWFLIPNGWNGNNVAMNNDVRYSDKAYNTFTYDPYRSHVVQLMDDTREILLLGFEDLNRPGGDNDFNDAVFYVTANPFSAVDVSDMERTTSNGNDADNDGIPDVSDAAPNDPTYAFQAFSPAQNQYASLIFEDQWPVKGDYDMNDMVVDYNVEERLNAANKVVQIIAKYKLRAMGAGYRNGFGVELGVESSKIGSVTGAELTESYNNMASNGCEANQPKAVVIPFNNGFDLMRTPNGGFVNTEDGGTVLEPVEVTITINFAEPVLRAELGSAPYNPFIMVNRNRGVEVHLPGMPPTALADPTLFGTGDDDTNLALGKYYQTTGNLPWSLHLPAAFEYPKEKTAINTAYLRFNQWVESAGQVYTDWYTNKSGYRDNTKVY